MNLLRPEFTSAVAEAAVQLEGAFAAPRCRPALVRRLLREPDAVLSALRALDSPEGMVLLGEAERLPWVDGLVYLRACHGEPSVWVPTTTAVSTPEDLFARALRAAHPELSGPLVALPSRRCLIALRDARPPTRAHLEGWKAPS